jgi:hypothetical protein
VCCQRLQSCSGGSQHAINREKPWVCMLFVCAGSANSIRTALKLTRPMGVLVSDVRPRSDPPEALLRHVNSVDGPLLTECAHVRICLDTCGVLMK